MSLKAIIFIGGVLSFLSTTQLPAQSSQQTIEWYTSFFKLSDQDDIDGKLALIKSALIEAKEIHDYPLQSKLEKEIGLIDVSSLYSYGDAMDHFIRALKIEDSVGIKEEKIFTYLGIAQVFESIGELQKSSESIREALKLNEDFPNPALLIYIENRLGKINAFLGKHEEAIENYEVVKNYKDQVDDPFVESEALFNLAQVYALQGKYPLALETHKEALALRRSLSDKKTESQSLSDIGELYRLMKNEEKALANHVVALEIRQALGDKKLLAESYNNIGQLYFAQKNYQRAVANLELALTAAQESQEHEELRKAYDLLSQCFEAAGDFKRAFEYKKNFVGINDLIQNEKNEQRIAETQNRYVIGQKQSQIESLDLIRTQKENELATQLQFRNFLMAIVALGAVVIVLVLFLYIQKRRTNKHLKIAHDTVKSQNVELHDLNATKDKFFSIISHDLKGPLNSLTSFSSLLINHTDSLSKDEIKMLAGDLDKSLKNLFALLENLLEWSRSQTGKIEFIPEHIDIAILLEQNRALLQTQASTKNITIQNLYSKPTQVNVHKQSVNTVIRNLISNAIKFTQEGGTITVNAMENENMLSISINDNGVGMPAEVLGKLFRIDTKHTTKGTANEKGTGLGLILCKDFIEKNGGKIWVESEIGKGSTFFFTIPLVSSAVARTAEV
jgi:signal transduction histidine kinase